ncbi:MAG: AAA family ATPase [Pirellulaceae bacterium]|nr:AAA family ATPase [Pirellulaceae bacterium]
MNALLHLGSLPPRTTRGTLVRLLVQVGGIAKAKLGAIEVHGREATIEVPQRSLDDLVRALDGTQLDHYHIRAWYQIAKKPGDEDHFQRLARLLDMEAEAEAEQLLLATQRMSGEDAQRAGTTLIRLVVEDIEAGLGNRTLVTLVRKDREELPWTRLDAGSPVVLSPEVETPRANWRGVISRRQGKLVQVAFEQEPEELGESTFRVDLAFDEVARRRQREALQRAAAARGDRLAELRQLLVEGGQFRFQPLKVPLAILDQSLNEPQREAVGFALSAVDTALIHGPPGTGKTTTVVELIRQAVLRGEQVLACAPSNLGVDNMLERLLSHGERAVRLGHPARVLPHLRDATLDYLVDKHPDARLAQKLIRQADGLRDRASRYTRAKPLPGAKREMRDEARTLLDDARRLERQAVQQILDQATVICATTTGLDSRHLGQRRFDLAVVDEACQTTEPGCWTVLLRCERLILAGDHCQLPPTVVSQPAAREGFGVSLLERLMDREGPRLARQLTRQYRMHQQIMEFSSDEFYEGSLVADDSVREHLLASVERPRQGLPGVQATELSTSPVHFIDTAGAGYDEQQEADGESRLNLREAEFVVRQAEELLAAGLPATQLGVITPYAAQVRLLRQQLRHAGLEVDSVDGFQGREKEAIIISLVRSNSTGEIGFLADTRRMNVALTRARRKLIVVGDSATIAGHPFYHRLLEYFELIGAYHTVWEY